MLHVHGDAVGVDADTAGGRPVLPCPTPYVAEHPSMQFAQKITIEDVAPAAIGPARGRTDIDLFGFIQFVSQRDIGRDQILALVGIEGRVSVVVAIEQRIRPDPFPRPTVRAAGRLG